MVIIVGDIEIDDEQFEVRRGETVLPSTPKVFDALLVLARNHPRVVTKRELLATVWAGAAVSDDAIQYIVRQARDLIGGASRQGLTIRTVRGRGYQLCTSDRPATPHGVQLVDEAGAYGCDV